MEGCKKPLGITAIPTVNGRVGLSDLGRTLVREHISCHMSFLYKEPVDDMPPHSDEFVLPNLGYIRHYQYCVKPNLVFTGQEMHKPILDDLQEFVSHGGKTILEGSSYGCNRNMKELVKFAELTKLNIVVGTGYYNASSQPSGTLNMDMEDIYTVIAQDIDKGCQDDPNIKAGFIGELACTWPLHNFEKKMIMAAAEMSQYSKHAVSIRLPGTFPAPWKIMRIFEESGGDSARVMLNHVENGFEEIKDLISFVDEKQCYCQFDMNLPEISYRLFPDNVEELYQFNRFYCIEEMLEKNLGKYIMLSNNIHNKHHLTEFGGAGYAKIDKQIIPFLKRRKTLVEVDEHQIMVENPKRWLCRC